MSNEQWSEWIEWNGGECPINSDAEFQVRLEDGCEYEGHEEDWDWSHDDLTNMDIIAYRYRLDDNTMTPEEEEIKVPERIGAKSKYHRRVKGIDVDVYDVLKAFNVTNQADAHAIKKMLCAGQRGYKDANQDRQEAIDSIKRAMELEDEV